MKGPEVMKPREGKEKDLGPIIQITIDPIAAGPQFNGNITEGTKHCVNSFYTAVKSRRGAQAVRLFCSIGDPKQFRDGFNPPYKESLPDGLIARATVVGKNLVEIGGITVVPKEGVEITVKPTETTSDASPAAGPYVQATRVIAKEADKVTKFLFVSGQMNFEPGQELKFNNGTFEEQTNGTIENVMAILNKQEMTKADIIKLPRVSHMM